MTPEQIALRRKARDGYLTVRHVLAAVDKLFDHTAESETLVLKRAVSNALQTLYELNESINAALNPHREERKTPNDDSQ